MRPVFCIFNNGAGPSLISAKVLDESWLDNILECNMRDIRSASDKSLVVSGTVTLHIRIGELHTRVTFDIVDKLTVPVLLGKILIDKVIISFQLAVRHIVLSHSMPLHLRMIHKAKSEAEKSTTDIREFND